MSKSTTPRPPEELLTSFPLVPTLPPPPDDPFKILASSTIEEPLLNYPDLKKHKNLKWERQQWKQQGLTFCKDPKCPYPLRVKLGEAGERQITTDELGRTLEVGVCMWDPRHCGGNQVILVSDGPEGEAT